MAKKKAPTILKYPGGKRRQAARIANLIGPVKGTLAIPFAGALSVYFEMAERKAFRHAVISDASPQLIKFWRKVQRDPAGLFNDLQQLPKNNQEEDFYRIREEFRLESDPARYLWLNRAGFNGLVRYSKKSGYNVPHGTYREQLYLPSWEAIEHASTLLFSAELHCRGFSAKALDADDAYCDPPYVGTFTGYTKEGFSMDDQKRLVRVAEDSRARVLISNSIAAKPLFGPRWKIHTVTEKRTIAANSNSRGRVTEILAICESSDIPR